MPISSRIIPSDPGGVSLKLVACPQCHAQYDVEHAASPTVTCRCGATFPATPPPAKDATVTRCSACGALVGEADTVCAYCHAEIVRRPAPSGPVCPECYARNPEGARYCVACGVAFEPQPIPLRAGSLPCPACRNATLSPRSLGGIWVEECASCLGLWAPGDIMDRLIEHMRSHVAQSGAAPSDLTQRTLRSKWDPQIAYRKCPECGVLMQRKNFGRRSGVVVDWCGSHGTWLDANELEDIANFVAAGGLHQAAGGGEDPGWALPADPNRMAAIAAAEKILAEERARTSSQDLHGDITVRSVGDLFALLLQKRF